MEYEKISGNKSINQKIHVCFNHISKKEVESFKQKFAEQPHEEPQVMHTFHELLVGAYLSSRGFKVTHEHLIESKTPDWCVMGTDNRPTAIVEVVNFHIDCLTEQEIKRQLEEQGRAAYWVGSNVNRLYSCLQGKFVAFKDIVEQHKLPYVVSLYGDFLADVELSEIEACLFDSAHGLFLTYPQVSGVLYFNNSCSNYHFKFISNPTPLHPFHSILDGVF